MRPSLPLLLLMLAWAPSPVSARSATEDRVYRLGPQDQLNIRVHTLRRNTGDTIPWTALIGEFSVGANGSVSMPILGELPAAGTTTTELAQLISRTLQRSAGLSEAPSASVEVVRYRPFYVLGAVQQPGQYEFRPGLTVLQALTIAQGLVRADDLAGVERETVTSRGDLRVLGAERVALQARIARLNAEATQAASIDYPAELVGDRADPRTLEAMREETLRFEVRRAALASELRAIEDAKGLLESELETLEAKRVALDRQLETTEKELRVVSDLVTRGLAVTPRQLAAESSQNLVESNRLDVQVAILRAQQSLARLNRDLVDLPARQREAALEGAATAREALNRNTERLRTAEQLLENASMRSAGQGRNAEIEPIYEITREAASGPLTRGALETDALQPGDVLRVRLPAEPGLGTGTSARSAAVEAAQPMSPAPGEGN